MTPYLCSINNLMIVAMYKVLLITVLLCIAEMGFAKMQIDLQAQARSPVTPLEVCLIAKR